MGMIRLSPLLHKSLVFMGRFSSRITVSKSMVCSECIQIELPELCDCEFTVRTKDLVLMLKHTQSFLVENGELKYSYEIPNGRIKVQRSAKAYEELYSVEGGVSLLSIVVRGFKVLSRDDHEIRADKEGGLVIESFGIVETRTEYKRLRVVESMVDSVHVRVRARDLAILERLGGDVAISFLDSHVLAYSLSSESTTIVQIKTLAA